MSENCKPTKYGVIVDHNASYADPLTITKGEPLTFVKKDEEFLGWIWCTNKAGKAGWIPVECFLSEHGDIGIALTDFDTVELTVVKGDIVPATRVVHGWAWCRSRNRKEGWLPIAKMQRLDAPS
jgi:hypothetical protein